MSEQKRTCDVPPEVDRVRNRVLGSNCHIRELDGVRGLAILMVLIWHYMNCQGAGRAGHPLAYVMGATRLFWSGVDLFFVLSGFLIGGILIDHWEKPRFIRTFFIRRAARIIPVYVVVLGLYFTLRMVLDARAYAWLFDNAIPDYAYITFTQNVFMGLKDTFGGHFLGVTWSLAVEEQFYVMLPLLVLAVGMRRFKVAATCLAVIAPCLRWAVPGLAATVNMPFRMDTLLAGVGLAFAFRSARIVGYVDSRRHLLWLFFCVLMACMAAMTLKGTGRRFLEPCAIAMFYASFVALAILCREKRVTAVLRSRLLVTLGVYAYGIYMYHEMIAGLVHGFFRGAAPSLDSGIGGVLTFLALVLTIVVSVVSYHGFESFFLARARRVPY